MTLKSLYAPLSYAVALLATGGVDQANADPTTPPSLRRGIASAWPAGLSLAARTVPFAGENGMFLKTSRPAQFPTRAFVHGPGMPDYSIGAMFPNMLDIEVDAHSSGNGVIPKLSFTGELSTQTSTTTPWVAIVASFGIGSEGTPTSNINRAVGARGHAGGDLIGYYLGGSTGINWSLPGHNVFESTRTNMNFDPLAVGDIPTLDIDALDYGIGMFASGVTSTPADPFFNTENLYFFSLSWDWCDKNPTKLFDGKAPDARVLYWMEWDGTHWSSPEIFADADTFNLAEGTDLDAIDVDFANHRMIFSAAISEAVTHEQVMYLEYTRLAAEAAVLANGPHAMPGAFDSGTPNTVDTGLGIGNTDKDDVRALCGIDPESTIYSYKVGLARNSMPNVEPMGLSVVRTIDALGANTLTVEASGWGDGDTDVDAFHITQFEIYGLVSGDSSWLLPTLGWEHLAYVPRTSWTEVVLDGTVSPYIIDNPLTGRYFLRATNFMLKEGSWVPNGQSWNSEILLTP